MPEMRIQDRAPERDGLIEVRVTPLAKIDFRKDETADGVPIIEGHAAVYDAIYEDWWGFTEEIAPGAFDDVLDQDVRCLANHDINHLLGRTTSGTLTIKLDDTGLFQRTLINQKDTNAMNWYYRIERRDLTGQSFAFTVASEKWDEEEGKMPHRTILKIGRLFDVGPVTYPAYEVTNIEAAKRSLAEFRKQSMPEARGGGGVDAVVQREMMRRRIQLARAKV